MSVFVTNKKVFHSLRTALIVPYVVLVILLAATLGMLSYQSGRSAALNTANYLLGETVNSIKLRVDQNVVSAKVILSAAFPENMADPKAIENHLDDLIERFWTASNLHKNFKGNIYFGTTKGAFLGLNRNSEEFANLFLKIRPEEHRKVFTQGTRHGTPVFQYVEKNLFDPRTRPWFEVAKLHDGDVYTSIYTDFRTRDLVATHARKILDQTGRFQGVVATDIPLKELSDFIKSLRFSTHGVAFIADVDGNLIASSCCKDIQKFDNKDHISIHDQTTASNLATEVYEQVILKIAASDAQSSNKPFRFNSDSSGPVLVAFSVVKNKIGLQWIHVAALPESDLTGDIKRDILQIFVLTLLATVAAIVIGYLILSWVIRDVNILSSAANRIGSGDLGHPINIRRSDEIGDLARSFQAMQRRLKTDHLTSLPNRYALELAVKMAIESGAETEHECQFALMFIDINNFKEINDQYGHDIGDTLLIEIALRLRTKVRQDDMVSRFAGDEFVILFRKIQTKEDLLTIKSNIIETLSQPLHTGGGALQLYGGAVGIACYPEDGVTAHELLIAADKEMYRHKEHMKRDGA